MNKKLNAVVFSLLIVISPTIFTSCITGLILGAIEQENQKSTAVFHQSDDGRKVAKTSKTLKEVDFQGSNFFIKDTPNNYFTDLNVQIFNLLKNDLTHGDFDPYDDDDLSKELKKTMEQLRKINNEGIVFSPADGTIVFHKSNQKVNGKKGETAYSFRLDINQQAYKEWNENLAYLKKCDEQIESCNWTIENCSAETLKKSKVVQVPYEVTERRWVPGDLGARTNSSFGSTASTPGHYEYDTYTIYKEETQYYTVANPNYNPAKVAQAKQNLPSWQNSKSATLEKMKYLPFTLINLGEGED